MKQKYPDNNPKSVIGITKVPMGLVPEVAIIHEAMAMADGARKYGPYNFRDTKISAMVYVHAAKRHLAAWVDGENNADDSTAHHLGHARACLAILLDAEESGALIDDRPSPGGAAALLKRLTAQTPKKKPTKKKK